MASEESSVLSKATKSAEDVEDGSSVIQLGDSTDENSEETSSSSTVFAGAMAQKVGSRGPILDDDIIDDSQGGSFSESAQSLFDEAGDRFAEVTKAVSEALLGSSTGTVEHLSSLADEQYSRALAAASSVLYGTTQGTAESITSVASAKFSDAVSA
jgi:hypothetical protein